MVKENMIVQIKNFANDMGLKDVNPIILSNAANLIIHLSPFNIVARIALYDPLSKWVKIVMQREIDIG